MDEIVHLKVPADAANERLDRFLAAQPAIGSRTRAQRLIASGRVRLNEKHATKSQPLEAGDSLLVNLSDVVEVGLEKSAEVDFAVVFEDRHLLIVDKPAGLVVHPAPSYTGPTLVEGLLGRARDAENYRPGLVHRLDKGTSGLMIVAKDDKTHRALQRLIRKREVKREYLALIQGQLDSQSGTVDAPIGRDRRDRKRMSTRTVKPRQARTHFSVVRLLARSTYLRARLETGRTHQIRVHFAAIGHPVVADSTYGWGETYGLGRQFLHSAKLTFQHPESGQIVEFSSDLPDDLGAALALAERESDPA